MVKTKFDPRCKELAKVFIQDYRHSEADINDLAWTIQDAVDNYLSGLQPISEVADG